MEQEKISNFKKKIRKNNNLTQKQLADKYNVTYQAVSKWERGLNMPDTALLKQMSKDFNVSLDDIFDGEYSKKKQINKKYIYIVCITLFILLTISIVIILKFKNDNFFEFKTLSSNCDKFNISGAISYNDKKSAIYISNIKYFGGNDTEKYKQIECTLYETNNDTDKKISSCNYSNSENITLDQFLQDVSFTIDNYSRVCKEYSKNSLYLEINATDNNDKTTYYKIPLSLEENCSK